MIEVSHLTKTYGAHTAVSDLSFTVEDGQVYGFLGPNGAGKSTTMNIITGCLAANSGTVSIDGLDIFEDAISAKKKIGYLPELPPLYVDMTTREYLSFVSKAKGIKKDEALKQIETVLKETGIESVQNRLIKNLSKGYKQRVGIAQALLGEPSIIILDEPTVGLDPKQIIEIRTLIKALGEKHTVILSSHILSEVQAICDKIMIISSGRLVACDTPENLEKLFAGKSTLEITAKAEITDMADVLADIRHIENISCKDGEKKGTVDISIEFEKDEDIAEDVFYAFCKHNKPILKMIAKTASLEDIFIELTSKDEEIDEPGEEKIKDEGGDENESNI
ncbi:MAG: ABC transporter ATP-binding protein [Bacillota bacterium]|nr:ABC transporter ATP-binding protein [Bacillota bacterium]